MDTKNQDTGKKTGRGKNQDGKNDDMGIMFLEE